MTDRYLDLLWREARYSVDRKIRAFWRAGLQFTEEEVTEIVMTDPNNRELREAFGCGMLNDLIHERCRNALIAKVGLISPEKPEG